MVMAVMLGVAMDGEGLIRGKEGGGLGEERRGEKLVESIIDANTHEKGKRTEAKLFGIKVTLST